MASVTIITAGGFDAGLRSDGNSKPMIITGPAGWQATAAQMGLAEVMLIDAQAQVHTTAPMRARLAASQQGRVASEWFPCGNQNKGKMTYGYNGDSTTCGCIAQLIPL